MIQFIKQQKLFFLISCILIVGAFLRFYKLDWGNSLFTHPDEYHIAGSVNQLSFPTQMHPHFFSYGTVTIYLIYFTQELLKLFPSILNSKFLILNSFLIGRFYSALFSTLTIIIVYKICRSFMERRFSYFAALLVAITPGLIQQAHFATPESTLTFFLFGSLLLILKFLKHNKALYLILASIALGFALGVKISSVVFLLPLIAAIIIKSYPKNLSFKTPILFIKQALKTLLKFTGLTLVNIIVVLATFAIVAPYVFLDFSDFRGNFEYEGGLAIGKIPVFYTRQFIDTMPILFQAEKILLYALGPFLFLFSTVGIIFLAINFVRKPKIELIMLILAFLSLFLTNALLFAKWTRFIAPTFPFFAIFAAISLQTFAKKTQRSVYYFLGGVLMFGTVLWTMSFFSIYTNDDIRITASKWIESVALPGSTFLVEGGNMIDIPLAGNFKRLGFNFYNFEENQNTRAEIAAGLERADYFLIQSRRVFYNHQRLPRLYPRTAHFYNALFEERMGFEQIKEVHSYPRLSLLGQNIEFPDEQAEETWSVFDHPVIRVFKKNRQLIQCQKPDKAN